MAHKNYIYGLRCITTSNYGSNVNLGLYQTGAENSEFRWIENSAILSTTPTTWATGFIVKDGIGAITSSFDGRRSGCIATMGGIDIKIENTYQNIQRIQDIQINFYQCEWKIYEFEMTTAGAENARNLLGTYCADSIKWNETNIEISLVNPKIRRQKIEDNIVTASSYPNALDSEIGKTIPATYGTFSPTTGQFAKLQQTGGKETIWTNANIDTGVTDSINTFPIIAVGYGTQPIQYTLRFTAAVSGYINAHLDITDLYIKIIEGNSGNIGLYRKLTSLYRDTNGTIQVQIQDVFPVALSGNSTATATTDQTWCQIVHIPDGFALDTEPCGGFLDSTGAVGNSQLFAYDSAIKQININPATYNPNFKPVLLADNPNFKPANDGCMIMKSDSNKNALDFNATGFKDKITNQDSFKIIPLSVKDSVGNYLTYPSDLTTWISGVSGTKISAASEHCSAIYADARWPITLSSDTETNENKINDKKWDTYYRRVYNVAALGMPCYVKILSAFKILESFENIDFDTIYLGLKIKIIISSMLEELVCFNFFHRRFIGDSTGNITNPDYFRSVQGALLNEFNAENIPDFYYYPNNSTNNKMFFDGTAPLNGDTHLYGYINIPLTGIDSIDKLKSLNNFIIYLNMQLSGDAVTITYDIYEVCLIFKKSLAFDNCFTHCNGRVFTSALWSTRRTADTVITAPCDIIEDIKRRELGGTAAINTTLFDATMALIPGAPAPAIQFTDNDKIPVLCRDWFLVNYIDKDGKECVNYLPDKTATSVATITLTDILGKTITIEEPSQQDIFCQPKVNYKYNYATDKYDAVLSVNNIDQTSFDFSYVSGITDYDKASDIWGSCQTLYKKYGQIEEVPSELTDKKSIVTYVDALQYLETWIVWMGKRRTSFAVAYITGHLWNLTDIITINLPHITDSTNILCKIEKILKNKAANNVQVDVIIMDDLTINTGEVKYQEVAGTVSTQFAESSAAQSTQLQEVI